MRLLRPELLWIAAAVVPLVILHLRWRRRHRVEVASLTVWREVARLGTGRRGLRRVRDLAPLAASVLAVLALAVAAAEPVTGRGPAPGVSHVIVLDASVTMSVLDVRDGGPPGHTGPAAIVSRLDGARETVRRVLERLGPRDDVTIWTAGERPRVLVGPTRDAPAAAAALEVVATTLAPRTLDATVRAARRSLALRGRDGRAGRDRGGRRLLVLTDAPDRVPGDTELPAVVVVPGGPGAAAPENRALRSLAFDGTAAVVEVSGSPGGHVVLLEDGREVGRAAVPVGGPAGDTVEVVIPLRADAAGEFTARLAEPDAFVADDAQTMVLARPAPLVIVVRAPRGQPSAYLLSALEALPAGLIAEDRALLADLEVGADVLASADVVITESGGRDDAPRPVPPGVATLTFGAGGALTPDPRLLASAHPVMRGVTAGPVRAPAARLLALRPGESALLTCDDGAVAAAERSGGARHVRIGLLPSDGTFALEGAFPVLLRNALVWLREHRALPSSIAAGDAVPLAGVMPEGTTSVELRGPGGPRTVRVGPGAALPLVARDHGGGLLGLHVPGDPEPLALTAVQWTPRPGTRLARGPGGMAAAAALDGLPPSVAPDPLRRHDRALALAAALFALLGGLLMRRGGGSRPGGRARIAAIAATPLGLRTSRPRARVP